MSATGNNIPDSIRPYLNEIAERLWSERAAVMVGAGFSKNAGDGFLDWNEFGDLFYQKAHGDKPDPTKHKYLNVLRLAEEVQAAIGRPALENLLRSNIPDLSNKPSGLHVQLLEMPWVDVFTTNYDTLLERASAEVVTRRYEPVVNKEDIAYAIKPRIVKLHGSFPSECPFIITEEDYRRYPHDYAPFVNTVRQALLENTFCLIGFSGDDPNFLQWIGWIRDNLGRDKTQKIYLVGVFDLSPARMQLFAQRGIIVLDFSCCDGIEKNDHKKALTKFFAYILSKKPHALDWPDAAQTIHPTRDADRVVNIQKITAQWRVERLAYPGWLILPHSNRESLGFSTHFWIDYLPNTEESPAGLDILYAYELIWRLERCLLPVFDNLARFCEELLTKYWPFPKEGPPEDCRYRADGDKLQDLPWDEIREAWLGIALAMLRFYREEGHLEKWEELKKRLDALANHLSAEQKEFLNYEGFLFGLFALDLPKAEQFLENWRPNESQPYWMAKKAAALAEIRLSNGAENLVRDALQNIRKKLNQNVGTPDLTLVSLESNAMLLGRFIQHSVCLQGHGQGDLRDNETKYEDRRNELRRFKCDPWNELKLFELTLNKPPAQRKDITEKHQFDIGRVTRTHHIGGTDREALSSFAFLRFCEEVGLPFRLGNTTLATKTALGSLERISSYSPFWATATLFRLGDNKAVDSLFNRQGVNKLTAKEADKQIEYYLDALHKCRDDIHSGDAFRDDNYGVRLAQLLPEVISRLCCKCSIETKLRVLRFVTELYASPDKANYRKVGQLTKRLISAMSENEQYSLVPALLEVPFPENLHPVVRDEFPNPFLLLDLNHKPECSRTPLEIPTDLLRDLFKQAARDDPNRRRWAISVLVKLYELELLNTRQSTKLGEVIWCKTDQHGLPENTDFYKFAFLRLPHPDNVKPSPLFKAYIEATPFPFQKTEQDCGVNMTGGNIPLVNEIIGAQGTIEDFWTTEETVEILQRLLEWWDADKKRLRKHDDRPSGLPSASDEFRSRFARLLDLIAKVVGPNIRADCDQDVKALLDRLLEEMQSHDLPVLEAKAACLHIHPEWKSDVYDQIREALISNQDNLIRDGLAAITKIILEGVDIVNGPEASEPELMLSEFLTWCKTYSIAHALWPIVRILKSESTSLSGRLETATHERLGKLLAETAHQKDNPDLTFDEKLAVRRVAAILAATLWGHYRNRDLPVPGVVEKWHEVCLSPDEFAEIRNAWKDSAKG